MSVPIQANAAPENAQPNNVPQQEEDENANPVEEHNDGNAGGNGNGGGEGGDGVNNAVEDHHENAEDPLMQENAEENAPEDNAQRAAVATAPKKEGFFEKKKRKKAEKTEKKARFAVLKRKLVDEKKESSADKKAVDDKVLHSDTVKNYDKAKKIGTYTNYAGIGVGVASLAPTIGQYGAKGISMAKNYGGMGIGTAADKLASVGIGSGDTRGYKNTGAWEAGENFYKTSEDEGNWWNRGAKIASLTGNSLSAIGNGISTGANIYNAKKSKSKYARGISKTKAWSAGLGTLGSASKAGSNAFDVALKNKGAYGVGAGVLDIAGGAASFGSSFLAYKANKAESQAHKQIAKDAKKFGGNISDKDMSDISAAAKTDKAVADMSEQELADYKAARKARHTAKAKKYAMQQAAALHAKKGEKKVGGFLGAIGGAISGLGALSTGIGKFVGGKNFGRTLGSLLGAAGGMLSGYGGMKDYLTGRKEEKGISADKRKMVTDYLSKKVKKIKAEAKQAEYSEEDDAVLGGKEISDFEAEKIALLRLGVNEAESAEKIDDDILDKAFEKLSEKRANNIFQSDKEDKKQMLKALGLDDDASVEDIKHMLMGNMTNE